MTDGGSIIAMSYYGAEKVVRYYDVIFFFQAEDGIRDRNVTGVQTCALPICPDEPDHLGDRRDDQRRHRQDEDRALAEDRPVGVDERDRRQPGKPDGEEDREEIGRASCRERV